MDENGGTVYLAPIYSTLRQRKELSIGLRERTLYGQNIALKIKQAILKKKDKNKST